MLKIFLIFSGILCVTTVASSMVYTKIDSLEKTVSYLEKDIDLLQDSYEEVVAFKCSSCDEIE